MTLKSIKSIFTMLLIMILIISVSTSFLVAIDEKSTDNSFQENIMFDYINELDDKYNSHFYYSLHLGDLEISSIGSYLILQLSQKSENSIVISNGNVVDEKRFRQSQISKLRGKTIEIYSFIVEKSDELCGIREIQRYFDYSSPNLVVYHLNKLLELNLVFKTNDNRYKLNSEAELVGEYKNKMLIFGNWIKSTKIISLILLILAIITLIFAVFQVKKIYWVSIYIPTLLVTSYKLYHLE